MVFCYAEPFERTRPTCTTDGTNGYVCDFKVPEIAVVIPFSQYDLGVLLNLLHLLNLEDYFPCTEHKQKHVDLVFQFTVCVNPQITLSAQEESKFCVGMLWWNLIILRGDARGHHYFQVAALRTHMFTDVDMHCMGGFVPLIEGLKAGACTKRVIVGLVG